MKRLLIPSTALLCALQTVAADAREVSVRQAQLIDFSRPQSRLAAVPAVESGMREAFADTATVVQPYPAGPRLTLIDHRGLFRASPRPPTANLPLRSPIIASPKAANKCAFRTYRPSPVLSRGADRRRQLLYPLVKRAACEANLPVGLMDALVIQESRYNPNAISPKGAFGLGQLMPGTARQLGVDRYSLDGNLRGAARYLSWQLREFGRVDLALAAYNAGPGRVRRVQRIPRIAETQNYVRNILANWQMIESNHLSLGSAQPSRPPTQPIWFRDFRPGAGFGGSD